MATASTAIAAPTVQPSAGLWASTLGIAKRGILKFLRTPQLIVIGTIQNALFLVIFRYVFGGAIGTSVAGGLSYVDFLIPGFITTGLLFSGMGSAAGIAEDLEQGFVDRLRSLPIPRSAVLAGRALADTVMSVYGMAISAAVGFAAGFRLHGSVRDALVALGLLVVLGFVFEWVFLTLGLFAGNAQAAQGMSLMVFPLTFVSSAYVPVNTMPGWLQTVAQHQPLTVMVDAVRVLTGGPAAEAALGHGASYYVTQSLLWAAGILVVFAPLAVARYRRG
jgi:ABC-2 type transport system permease protein